MQQTVLNEDQQKMDEILKFWFGRVEETIVPTENRARIWFGEDPGIDAQIRERFLTDLEHASRGDYDHWSDCARGQLALIILLDQFSRHVYRNSSKAYSQDRKALHICALGIEEESEHELSLIERVFYYFPLLHAEQVGYQEQSIRAYQMLSELAFIETRVIYDSFLKFANHHYTIIRRFGRFPQRNGALNRESSEEELAYLKEIDETEST